MPYTNKDAERSATDELLRRIKELSREETRQHQRANDLRAEAQRADAAREQIAIKRRQYEFAMQTLDGEDVIRIPIEAAEKAPRRSCTA